MMKNLLIYGLLAVILYKTWGHFTQQELILEKNHNGFTQVVMPSGTKEGVVYILAPQNCPKAAGQRADALEQTLRSQGVAVVRKSSVSYNVVDPTPEQVSQVDNAFAIMKGTIPAVFVNGMASSNPQADEVVAQWRGL